MAFPPVSKSGLRVLNPHSPGLHKFLEHVTKASSDSQASPEGRHATGNFQIADNPGVARQRSQARLSFLILRNVPEADFGTSWRSVSGRHPFSPADPTARSNWRCPGSVA